MFEDVILSVAKNLLVKQISDLRNSLSSSAPQNDITGGFFNRLLGGIAISYDCLHSRPRAGTRDRPVVLFRMRQSKEFVFANEGSEMKKIPPVILLVILYTAGAWGQRADVAAKLGYPQMILYNGKIVSMDDPSFASRVGTIV